jgi:streptogramin lyase
VRSTAKAPSARSTTATFTELRKRFGIAAALLAVVALALPAFASADPLGSATFYKEGLRGSASFLGTFTPGPDGNVWFVDNKLFSGAPAIGRVTPEGTITDYIGGAEEAPKLSGLNEESDLISIVAGPGGSKYLWFTDRGTITPSIGVIDSTSPETATEFSIQAKGGNEGSMPEGIAVGPEGNLWFTDANEAKPAIGKIVLSSKNEIEKIEEFSTGLNPESKPLGIVAGADGNLWFTDGSGITKAIGRINPSTHEIKEFATGENSEPGGQPSEFGPWGIVAGPDGNVWFTEAGTNEAHGKSICNITPSGTITCSKAGLIASSKPSSLTAAGGKLWFTDNSGVNEEQELEIKDTTEGTLGGTYKLVFGGKETGATGTGNVVSGSKEIKSVTTSTGAFSNGEQIEGEGIPPGDTIASGAGTATLKLAVAATGSKTGAALTANLGYKATGSQVAGALQKLSTIGSGGASGGGTLTIPPIKRSILFEGARAHADVEPLTCNGAGLTGTSPTCTVTTLQQGAPNAIGCMTTSGEACGEVTRWPFAGLYAGAFGIAHGSDGNLWVGSGIGFQPWTIGKFGIEETGIPLKVTHEGAGGGTIQSSPAGITCTSGECEHKFTEGAEVTLTASPNASSQFVAWKNCDTGGVHGRQCTVHVTAGHKTVGAKFEPANTVTVKTKGNGTGSVSGVTCGNTCTEAQGIFLASKAVTLKAKPYTKTSEFKGWTASPASCTLSEGGLTCSLGLLSANETVEAEFAEIARENLKVTKSGKGQGSVKSSPAGINCSYTCPSNTAYFYKGASVTLTASVQEGKGSTLGNWGGACSGTEATPCVVSMSEAKEVTAEFK